MNYHKKLINSMVFFNNFQNDKEFLVSGGHDNFIILKEMSSLTNDQDFH